MSSASRGSALIALFVLALGCASGAGAKRKYPPRRPGCALLVYHSLPEVTGWDDIGVADVGCYLDESEVACLHRLRAEACRMGGNIIYDVPKRALRPTERGMVFRARVAHTVEHEPRKAEEKDVPDAGAPPAAAVDSKNQIAPLPRADGGTP